MNSLDELPFKIPRGSMEPHLLTAPDITIPDYLQLLRETEYDFHLEKWLLAGLVGGHPSLSQMPLSQYPLDVTPSCPPYWLMFSRPQECQLASKDIWGPICCQGGLCLNTQSATSPLDSKSQSPHPRQPPTPPAARPLGSHTSIPDLSAELLSALSREEQDLLEAVAEEGYPLSTAIAALQETSWQDPEQVLSYLLSCVRLCQLGYEEAQVLEALEMFQNCESKATEFLRLLDQFNEMGFQQNTIKEVLLVNENHGEKALEELMMRAV